MFCNISPEYDRHDLGGVPPAPSGHANIPDAHEQLGVGTLLLKTGPLKLIGSLGQDPSIHDTPRKAEHRKHDDRVSDLMMVIMLTVIINNGDDHNYSDCVDS